MAHASEREGGVDLDKTYREVADKRNEREDLVHEHMHFKPDAKVQDLFALDEGAIEDLARLAPTVDLENKKGLEKIPEGTVVHVRSKAEKKHGPDERFDNQLGVVYDYVPGEYMPKEKRVRMLYEVVIHYDGAGDNVGEQIPERRWNKWEQNPETGAMRPVEIKAVTSKKVARGGAVKDVEAHWRNHMSGNAPIREHQDFNGDRQLQEFILDDNGKVKKYMNTREHKGVKSVSIADLTRKPFAVEYDIYDGKESEPRSTMHLAEIISGVYDNMKHETVNPARIRFEHGSYYMNEDEK